MEDPWAAGASWATPAKSATSRLDLDDARSFTPSPPPNLDDSDPWGVQAQSVQTTSETISHPASSSADSKGAAANFPSWTSGGWTEKQSDYEENPSWRSNSPAGPSKVLPPFTDEVNRDGRILAEEDNERYDARAELEETDNVSPGLAFDAPVRPAPSVSYTHLTLPTKRIV